MTLLRALMFCAHHPSSESDAPGVINSSCITDVDSPMKKKKNCTHKNDKVSPPTAQPVAGLDLAARNLAQLPVQRCQ